MPTCPTCQADLTDSMRAAEGLNECPFCGVELNLPDESAGDASSVDMFPRENQTSELHPPLPANSRIEIVEQSPDRLVLHVPPGGASTKSLGCFALIWNGFMCVFTPPWFLAMGQADGPPLYIIVPFLLVFWSIGLGMAYAWLRMKFTRHYLLLEPSRMVLQTQWLRSKCVEEAPLTVDSRAKLVESYQMNEVPVHRIEVPADGHVFQFGTHLSEPEKEWIKASINRFLGVDEQVVASVPPKTCWSCGQSLGDLDFDAIEARGETPQCPHCGEPQSRIEVVAPRPVLAVTSLSPRQLPTDSLVQIEDDSPDHLIFSLPLLPEGQVLRIVSRVATLIGIIWVGISGTLVVKSLLPPPRQAIEWIGIVFRLIPLLPGIAILWLGLTVRRGKIHVSIDRDWFRVHYRAGFVGKRMRYVTSSIEAVRLRAASDFQNRGRNSDPRSSPGAADHVAATVHCGKSFLPLTTLHGRDVAETVAGLVQGRLQDYGVRLTKDAAT